MKRICAFLLSACLMLGLCACGQKADTSMPADAPTWQEQYDLGIRYLSEGNYEEAIIAFTAAIEIDPKRPEGYLGLADAYIGGGDRDAAKKILEDALGKLGETAALEDKLAQLSSLQTPLEGYPKTEREELDDGGYIVWEYDQYGNGIVMTRYDASGQAECRIEWTYDGNGTMLSSTEQSYDPEDAMTKRVSEYDAEGRPIHVMEYWKDDTQTFMYAYQGKEVTVDMVIVSEQYGEVRDSFHYTLSEDAHYMEIRAMGYSDEGIDVGQVEEFDEQGCDIREVEFWED